MDGAPSAQLLALSDDDPEARDARRRRRRARYYGRTIPLIRVLAMSMMVAVAVGTPWALDQAAPPGFALGLEILVLYTLLGLVLQPIGVARGWWWVFEPSAGLDVFMVGGFVLASGGSESPWFWVTTLRLSEMSAQGSRRAWVQAALPALVHIGILGLEGTPPYALDANQGLRIAGLLLASIYATLNLQIAATDRRRLGDLLGVARGLSRDVQARNAALEVAAAENARLARAKSTFLAQMSHELRTPLNGIIGMIEALGRSELSSDQRHQAEVAASSAHHLLALINDVLDHAKLEADKVSLHWAPTRLADVTDPTLELARARLKGPVVLRSRRSRDLPDAIRTDATRLKQILLNLLGNAIKFTASGEVALEVRLDGDDLLFEVSDSGLGIPADQLESVFEPFSQAGTDIYARFGGTGLGLGISRQLAERLGGALTVRSVHGEGSVFTLRLPHQSVALPETPQTSPAPQADFEGRILLVEDNLVNAEVAGLMLEALGLTHDHAPDGETALRMTETQDYALVLLDVQMPGMNGLDVARALRARGGRQPLIVALTANAFEDDKRACEEAGMNGFIAKPVTLDALQATLATLGA